MPLRYSERLRLPLHGDNDICFTTPNGLPLAKGYTSVVLTDKGPLVEFSQQQVNLANVSIPQPLLWRRKHPEAYYVEYRSRDYCNIKVIEQKRNADQLKAGMYYVSAFDMTSDRFPTLIERLHRRRANND